MQQVSECYLMGIREGREAFERHGMELAKDELENLKSTMKGFSASSEVGQMLRGEYYFWENQLKLSKKNAILIEEQIK